MNPKLPPKLFANPTLLLSGSTCLVFLVFAGIQRDNLQKMLAASTDVVLTWFGGFYLVLGLLTVLLLLVLAFSPFGKIRFGQDKPAYSWYSWIAMMYSTGMGAGLLLRAVQEPAFYFQNPPREGDYALEVFALQYTFFHWGLTPWAFYTMFGLIVGYQLFCKKKTILSSSILGDRFQKPVFTAPIDSVTVISTMLGVVAAVGLGSRQVLEGLSFLGGLKPFDSHSATWVVLAIGIIAGMSAYLGVSKGIRIISNLNIALALLLMLFTIWVGNVGQIFQNFFLALYEYLIGFFPMSLNLGEFQVGRPFLKNWTYFYWAFWLAWAPFTGVFIARISKGRSIRGFILGALLVPSLGTFLWFSVFGSSAFRLLGSGQLQGNEFDSLYTAIFRFFDFLPQAELTSWLSLFLVCTFLVTSVDSAIYVLGMFTDHGRSEPRKSLRVFWAITLVAVTVTVIILGKDELLNAVSNLLILFALPFSFLFLGMMGYFVVRGR
ncbi:BCCT family transporter [Litoribacter alkaliphilus]|uniref:BCCT family transporter n=1 Tax=Litoribacter ruber TaxID=702568 RepID=A0AAP2G2E1_9BACT|nr:BCCT family transporter [Litoribacter alkaliphilus]MBS9525622.1 BCCT family transporter [Litoribacter alkaliphilus]